MDAWLDALCREMSLYADDASQFDSLYIGGGTPTVLDGMRMERLFSALHGHFTFARDTEISVEANPDDIGTEKLACLQSLGVNRLSFGVQSFNDSELAFLGRRHDAAGALKAITLAQDAGFENIGIDLMYGLPMQTKASWRRTLEQAVSLMPKHLSCYQLTVEGRTPLGGMIARGAFALPGEKAQEDFFLLTSRMLERRGFTHYEISNFAAGDEFMCRHNRKYWAHVPYLGLGPAAHSFDGASRWWNHRSVERYCEALARGEKPVEGTEHLSEEQLALERLYLGLRTRQGVTAHDIPEGALPAVKQLKKSLLLRVEEDRIYPTRRGYLVADSLPVLLS